MSTQHATVIGAGLAGCEAAWQLARRGIRVTLIEQKPHKKSPAHQADSFAELVCSNSLRADNFGTAPGLLKAELRRLSSLIIGCADETKVEAGGALAVDREAFTRRVTEKILAHPLITVEYRECTEIPEGEVIIATGPLTEGAMAERIHELCGDPLNFFDASAPLVVADSIDMEYAFYAARYDRGTPDYINCPMSEEEYNAFWQALTTAETADVHGFENHMVFEGCMPIEVMALRGQQTIAFGPLRPVGLTDPKTGKMPYTVVQLRKDNAEGTLYNIVGFQTHLKHPEQKRVFSMIPALHKAEFARYGVMHRNSFLNSPELLDAGYALRSDRRIRFAGQMTGVEGYIESTASGYVAGFNLAQKLLGQEETVFPRETAIGALALYISEGSLMEFQPMNVNFGIMTPLEGRYKGKRNKKEKVCERALQVLETLEPQFRVENEAEGGNEL
ncbi:MAG: methylenetetrahydrofolate--tRNA-(uracil(54)-C(5))-methyltransferase (FADH(2)-oxidizing) TrmFO [Clostridia bacterium]|nr:methylenetetrahydrofolate--tRNA-(uracil(54)-C(5))-methyltransferase (FADH(2)-oxidizing) TrmFO [Clostridia bacterium]